MSRLEDERKQYEEQSENEGFDYLQDQISALEKKVEAIEVRLDAPRLESIDSLRESESSIIIAGNRYFEVCNLRLDEAIVYMNKDFPRFSIAWKAPAGYYKLRFECSDESASKIFELSSHWGHQTPATIIFDANEPGLSYGLSGYLGKMNASSKKGIEIVDMQFFRKGLHVY